MIMQVKLYMKLLLVMFTAYGLIQAEKSEKISRILELSPEKQTLYLKNLNGSVTINGSDENVIGLNAEKLITSDNSEGVNTGFQEVQLSIEEVDDGYFIFTDIPCNKVDLENKRINYCQYEWEDYDFEMNLELSVPGNINIDVSTINNGIVSLTNITGNISATNVNGPVYLEHVSGLVEAMTVNGEMLVEFDAQPLSGSTFKTVNGSIELIGPADLSAEIDFSSMHGDFYTNYADVVQLPNRFVKTSDKKNIKSTYEISSLPLIRIGRGDHKLSFETLNGDIYLRNKENH